MTDHTLEAVRSILKHLTIDEAFNIAERYADEITGGSDGENGDRVSIQTARFLRDFILERV